MQTEITGFLAEIRDLAPGWSRLVLRVEAGNFQPLELGTGRMLPCSELEIAVRDGSCELPGPRQTVKVKAQIVPAQMELTPRNRGDQARSFPRVFIVGLSVEVLKTKAA